MKFLSSLFFRTGILMILALSSAGSIASAVINSTRVIYPSDSKEVSVKITNNGSAPVLIQSWIDNGDQEARPSTIKVPFVLTPPINRVDAGKGQTLRISYTGVSLPMDKESVYWLNVLEVPGKNQAKANENSLQMAFRSRIKLFYRPAGLQGNANDAPKTVLWHNKNSNLEAINPTPYYVNFVNLIVNGKKVDAAMISPHSRTIVNLQGKAGDKISGAFVNDYGAVINYNAEIK